MNHWAGIPSLLILCLAPLVRAQDIGAVPQDLTTPPVVDEAPGRGKRVRQVNPDYAGSGVYHALYLGR